MNNRQRWTGIVVSGIGAGVCLVALAGFFWTILSNNLPWSGERTTQQYYLAVGDAYGQGFVTGFFLCFFLLLVTVLAHGLIRRKRKATAETNGATREAEERAESVA